MQEIFVSVVVCTYNRCKYLEKCLNSLLEQNYYNYEIIVVNGPSTDETNLMLDKFSNIIVIEQESLNGLSFARNLGILASKGDIIAFLMTMQ